MDPCAQDVIRCDLCETAIVQMYCDFCHVNLCITCIGKHVSDDYDKHIVVPIQNRKSTLIYPRCTTHDRKRCELQCKECNLSVCSVCVFDQHLGHTFSNLSKVHNARKADIGKDEEEIQNIISPKYDEIATDIKTQIANLKENYKKLTTAVTTYGEEWHKEIDNVINRMKNELEEMGIAHLDILNRHLDEIQQLQTLIEQTLLTIKRIEKSNDISVTMEYSSQNKEFSKFPPKVQVTLPTFSPNTVVNPNTTDSEQVYKLLGSLIPLCYTTEENGYTLEKTETLAKELMEKPELVSTIDTGYEKLSSVVCLSEEDIWTSAKVNAVMKCFNIQGSLIKTIETKSGERPSGITVTTDGSLVYCDRGTNTVNKVKSGQTEEVIRLQGWIPQHLCVTSSGDLLVIMLRDVRNSDDVAQSKIVRYSGSTEKQTIQFDDQGQPLYSSGPLNKYISENRNLDICVADLRAGAVVVVNQSGKLRFRYTGRFSLRKRIPLIPRGIATNSQSQILTLDRDTLFIHILDQNGQFLRYIDNCNLNNPVGLYVDKSDSMYVAEMNGSVKKFKYLQ
ncbi:uncharacterized protein LOC125649647 [Ostrea edulis]|uniref:uncharacterized protein LOC125649647 n=1 Tax=Ostrea edulis TaxID=37623 RepID=UPI0024AFA972|nr:uncharacterized protein LOC125649647 [Ostrea edulis]